MAGEELSRDLGLLEALTIGVGTMIGGGIFVLPGLAAEQAGPAVIVSYVLGGLIALLTALSLAEMATGMPQAGGSYYYITRALGPLFGSMVGIGVWNGLMFASAFYLIGFGQYLTYFFSLPVNISAVLLGAFLIAVNCVGTQQTGRLQNIIVLVLIGILTAFAVVGATAFDFARLEPFNPYGWGSVVGTAGMVFISFMGFEVIANVAEEIENPSRNIPLAMLGSVGLVMGIYAVVLLAALGAIPLPEFVSNATPIAFAAEHLAGVVGAAIVVVGAILATISSANASILSASRVNFAMGRDGIMTNWVNEIHKRFLTPSRSIMVSGVVILALVAVGKIDVLAEMASFIYLITYSLVQVSLVVMRESEPSQFNPSFKAPGYPLTQIVGVLACLALAVQMRPMQQVIGGAVLLLGVTWFFAYGRKHTSVRGVAEAEVDTRRMARDELGTQEEEEGYRVLVPVANPLTERGLMRIAGPIAKSRDGSITALNVITVPDQTPLYVAQKQYRTRKRRRERLLEAASKCGEKLQVPVRTKAVFSHRVPRTILTAASSGECGMILMGWQGRMHRGRLYGRGGVNILRRTPCDIAVLRDRGHEYNRILVPIGGGPHVGMGVEIARDLARSTGAEVTLLAVVPPDAPETKREEMQRYISEHLAEVGLEAEELIIEGDDVANTIVEASKDYDLVILGASRKWLVKDAVFGSIPDEVADRTQCSVLMVKRWEPRPVTWIRRLFNV